MRQIKDNKSKYSNLIYFVLVFVFGAVLGVSITACVFKIEIKENNTETYYEEPNVNDDSNKPEHEPSVFIEPETEEPRQVYYPKERDIIHLAKALYGECQNLISQKAKESIAWCLLNRYDTCRYASIRALVSAPFEVLGYREENEVVEEYYNMARDIITKWHYEKETGIDDKTRTLSKEYLYYILSPDDVEFLTSWYDSNGVVMQ